MSSDFLQGSRGDGVLTDANGRDLGLWSATALVVGHTIGVGIFLTPAELIGGLRSPALTLGLWVVCGVLVLAGALTFGELASRYPQAGGPYIYLREGWGARMAFLYGWQSLLIVDPGVTAVLTSGCDEGAGTRDLGPGPARERVRARRSACVRDAEKNSKVKTEKLKGLRNSQSF